MTTMSSTLIKKIMSASSCLSLVVLLNSCSKENDFKPELLELENKRVPAPVVAPLNNRELLGKYIYFDASLSASAGQFARGGAMTQSCASCHLPQQGYAGFESGSVDRGQMQWGAVPFSFKSGIGEGAVEGSFGGRKPPSAAYATFSPKLKLGTLDVAGQYQGGLFWDGRATGAELGNPAAEQARGPFLADKEHNFNTVTGRRDLLVMIRQGSYYPLYKTVYGAGLDNISLTTDPASQLVTDHYNNVAFAIAAYEASSDVNQFSSKYDDVMARRATFNAEEAEGYRLMRSSATKNCGNSGCHAEKGETGPALFTDFTYDNIGLPWKSEYRREESLQKGAVDQGIYTTLVSPNVPRDLPVQNPEAHIAAFKTPTLRNVALGENARSGGPGRGKRFMHNGIFSSLEEVMHFYNTRDVVGAGWSPSAKADVKTNADWRPWGAPEYAQTMHRGPEIGNLGLTVRQEKAIVAFMRTLSDTRPVTPPPAYRATATQQITN